MSSREDCQAGHHCWHPDFATSGGFYGYLYCCFCEKRIKP